MRLYTDGDKRHIGYYGRMVLQGVIGRGVIFWVLPRGWGGGLRDYLVQETLTVSSNFTLLCDNSSNEVANGKHLRDLSSVELNFQIRLIWITGIRSITSKNWINEGCWREYQFLEFEQLKSHSHPGFVPGSRLHSTWSSTKRSIRQSISVVVSLQELSYQPSPPEGFYIGLCRILVHPHKIGPDEIPVFVEIFSPAL